jgi:hypothetical protein
VGAVRGVIDSEAPAVQIDEEVANDARGVTVRLMARGATRGHPGMAGNHRRRTVWAQSRSVRVGDVALCTEARQIMSGRRSEA